MKDDMPKDENNIVWRAALKVFGQAGFRPPGIKAGLVNNIPVARGMGSSSAC